MPAHLTAAQARALRIDAPKAGKARTTRRTARGPYASTCFDCGEAFTTQAAETRHLNATRHPRYQLALTLTPGVYDQPMSNTPPTPDPAVVPAPDIDVTIDDEDDQADDADDDDK